MKTMELSQNEFLCVLPYPCESSPTPHARNCRVGKLPQDMQVCGTSTFAYYSLIGTEERTTRELKQASREEKRERKDVSDSQIFQALEENLDVIMSC